MQGAILPAPLPFSPSSRSTITIWAESSTGPSVRVIRLETLTRPPDRRARALDHEIFRCRIDPGQISYDGAAKNLSVRVTLAPRAAQGTAVSVTLSLGPRVAVPPLIGKNMGDATTIVRAAGLVLVSTRVEGAPGIVMEQEPAAGTLVSRRHGRNQNRRPPFPRGPLGPIRLM